MANDEYKDSEVSIDLLSISSGTYSLIDSWFWILLAHNIMCLDRPLSETFKSYNFGIVLTTNDARCKVIEISTIKVRMFDKIVRTLTNVRYVLDLKKI